jgi:putative RecB family exonuclease
MPRGLSPSAFGAFKSCPLAFKFSYLDRLPQPPSPAASKGTLVHRALERLMLRDAPARTLDAALADLDRARADFADDPEFTGLELDAAGWAAFHEEAAQLVHRYFELEDPVRVRPIGLELRLEATVHSLRLRGVIDRLELDDDDELVITDYETGSVPGERYELQRLAGVHMYALMVEQVLGRRPVRVQLLYLTKPEAIIAVPSDQTVNGVARKSQALWKAITVACARDDFRPHPGPLCQWCTYQAYCPAFGGDPQMARELHGPGTVIAPTLPLASTPA